jgi:hypothetical protein
MPLDGELKRRLEHALSVVDDHGTRGTRLLDDARRFCARIRMLIARGVVPAETDSAAMEVACMALQLPIKATKTASGKPGRTTLRDRAEQAAEMLVGLAGQNGDEAVYELIDQTTALLVQVHQRVPATDQAKLLADALNLEDFGVSGLIAQAIALARQGGGVLQVADGCEKREQYGYWEARLKDGFHFEQTRQIARKRLEQARKTATLLMAELKEDGAL